MKETIKIIGADPAGLAAAIVLRRHGFPVKVFDKSPDVGHRLNGDFQGLETWSAERDIAEILRETGIEINFLFVPTINFMLVKQRDSRMVSGGSG